MFLKKEMLFIAAFVLLVFVGHTSISSHANDNNNNATPSPDFNGNGVVDIPDFLMFVESFGLRQGDAEYETRFDLDGDGTIGIGDFLIFVDSFGKEVPSDFTSPQIYNDNIFILPVSGDLAPGRPPLADYARFFYEHFEDEFDFLIFVRNFVSGIDVDESRTPYSFIIVKNEVQGIGRRIFSNADRWGSSGRLQGSILLVWVEFPQLSEGRRLFKTGPILHEIAHRWANFIIPNSHGGHWGFSSADGVVGGFDITNLMDHGGGQYTAGSWGVAGPNRPAHFSPIELYLAGFIPPDEVPDLWVAEDGTSLRDDQGRRIWNENGPIFTASQVKTYTIEDIIAEHGPRVPDVSQSQKDFRAAVILLTDEKHPAKLDVLKRLSDDISWFCHVGDSGPGDTYRGIDRYNFYEATGGRGTITMDGLSQLQRSAGAKRPVPSSFGTPPPPIVDYWDERPPSRKGADLHDQPPEIYHPPHR